MVQVLLIVFILAVVGVGAAFFVFIRRRPQDQSFLLLQNQMQELTRVLDSRLNESSQFVQGQFGTNIKIIQEVSERLVKLDETNKQVINFADQLRSLQDILKNPKQRGILGEYFLETLLKNVLPPGSYEMQYAFPDGNIVDAVVFVKDKVIPIDAKFSLENYNRIVDEHDIQERERLEKLFRQDLKNRIDETAKYIKPEYNTMDFALMFIPAEAIYYDLLINRVGAIKVNTQDLIQYAVSKKRVIIVSPTSFLAYLQTVLQGLRGLQIEESVKEVQKRVEELMKHLQSYEMYIQKLGKNLGTSVTAYNSAYKEFGKIDKDILRITDQSMAIKPEHLEGPGNVERPSLD